MNKEKEIFDDKLSDEVSLSINVGCVGCCMLMTAISILGIILTCGAIRHAFNWALS